MSHAGAAPASAGQSHAAEQPSGGAEYDPADYASEPADATWLDDPVRDGEAWSAEAEADDPWSNASLTRWSTQPAPAALNAIRGFPPAPGDPMPVYPPGPFAPWNRSPADRRGAGGWARGGAPADSSGQIAATITPDEFDTNHSIPAIKDPVLGKASGSRSPAGPESRSAESPVRSRASASRSGPAAAAAPETSRAAVGGSVPVRERGPLGDPAERKPAGTGGRRTAGPSRGGNRSQPKRHHVWLAIVAAVVIIVGGTTILVLTSNPGSPSGTTAGRKPPRKVTHTPAASKPPPGKWGYIGSRSTDSVPLTAHELYPYSFRSSGDVYDRVKTKITSACGGALIGAAVQAAVKHAGCNQAVRGTYLAKSLKLMATIGVFNLDTVKGASLAASKVGHNNFVAPLQSKAGLAAKIGQGTGVDEAIVKGHYLVIVWAETTGLQAPKSQRSRLDAFMNLLIAKTANVDLSYRMAFGKPMPTPSPGSTA